MYSVSVLEVVKLSAGRAEAPPPQSGVGSDASTYRDGAAIVRSQRGVSEGLTTLVRFHIKNRDRLVRALKQVVSGELDGGAWLLWQV